MLISIIFFVFLSNLYHDNFSSNFACVRWVSTFMILTECFSRLRWDIKYYCNFLSIFLLPVLDLYCVDFVSFSEGAGL